MTNLSPLNLGFSQKETQRVFAEAFLPFSFFGTVGDGITDDTDALEAALNYAQDNYIKLQGTPKETYLVTRNIPLVREGKAVLDIDLNRATLLFNPLGRITLELNSVFLTTALSAEVVRGSNKLPLTSVIGVLPGDIVHINSPAHSNKAVGAERLYTLHYYVVNEVVGNDVYIQGATVSDISVAQITNSGIAGAALGNITVTVRRPTADVYLKNGYVEINDPTTPLTFARLDLNGCRASYVENIHFNGHARIQLYQRNSAYTVTKDCSFKNAGYISEDLGYVAPLSSGYGYGTLHERNFLSKVINSHGTLCWHVFDATEGQMHIYYEDCVATNCTPGFSTHSNSWHVNWINCHVKGGGGFSGFRCHYPTLIGCTTEGIKQTAFNYAACCLEINLHDCKFESNFSGSYSSMLIASSGGDPKVISPGAYSEGCKIIHSMKRCNLSATVGLSFSWQFGVDEVNSNSELIVEDCSFYRLSGWAASGFARLHAKSFFIRNKVYGEQSGQFFTQYYAGGTHPVGSEVNYIQNVLGQDSVMANNALLYAVTPSANITYNFIGNVLNKNDNLVRVNTGGTLTIGKLEQNNCVGKLFSKNDATATTINVAYSLANIYNTVATNLTSITITKASGNIDKALI